MHRYKQYISFMALLLTCFAIKAQSAPVIVADTVATTAPDSLRVSILTCTPGRDLYAKFGHTALRVTDYTNKSDIVYNYGCFNYNSDNFAYKFILGQTDYMLGAEPFNYFIYRYSMMSIGVSEQELTLSSAEKNRLHAMLKENMLPENQEYRYKWLYDNCTERARDMMESAVDGEIDYEGEPSPLTVRDMLRQCLRYSPWASFGIDMILGSEIDQSPQRRVQMFLPQFFAEEAKAASIKDRQGRKHPLVADTTSILARTYVDNSASLLSPIVVFSILMALSVVLCLFEWVNKIYVAWYDCLLHLLQGVAGLLVAFLFFFSEHPAVSSNWLVIIFNPLPLLYACWLIHCHNTRRRNWLAVVNLAANAGFLATMAVCPQSFDAAMWVVVSCLTLRALSQTYFAHILK